MALSMEERRILAEIEQELERSEPALAAFLAAFGRPGRAALRFSRPPPVLRSARARLRSPRVLVVASLAALVLLTVIPVVVYTLVSLHVSLRPGSRGQPAGHSAVSARHHSVLPHPITSVPR
jgi:Protein of unknown function (DUF3040)